MAQANFVSGHRRVTLSTVATCQLVKVRQSNRDAASSEDVRSLCSTWLHSRSHVALLWPPQRCLWTQPSWSSQCLTITPFLLFQKHVVLVTEAPRPGPNEWSGTQGRLDLLSCLITEHLFRETKCTMTFLKELYLYWDLKYIYFLRRQ